MGRHLSLPLCCFSCVFSDSDLQHFLAAAAVVVSLLTHVTCFLVRAAAAPGQRGPMNAATPGRLGLNAAATSDLAGLEPPV